MLEFILKQYCIRRNILIAATVQSSRSMRQIPAVLIREFIPQIKPTYKNDAVPSYRMGRRFCEVQQTELYFNLYKLSLFYKLVKYILQRRDVER